MLWTDENKRIQLKVSPLNTVMTATWYSYLHEIIRNFVIFYLLSILRYFILYIYLYISCRLQARHPRYGGYGGGNSESQERVIHQNFYNGILTIYNYNLFYLTYAFNNFL